MLLEMCFMSVSWKIILCLEDAYSLEKVPSNFVTYRMLPLIGHVVHRVLLLSSNWCARGLDKLGYFPEECKIICFCWFPCFGVFHVINFGFLLGIGWNPLRLITIIIIISHQAFVRMLVKSWLPSQAKLKARLLVTKHVIMWSIMVC